MKNKLKNIAICGNVANITPEEITVYSVFVKTYTHLNLPLPSPSFSSSEKKKLCTSLLGNTNRLPISAHIIAIYGGRLVQNYFILAP